MSSLIDSIHKRLSGCAGLLATYDRHLLYQAQQEIQRLSEDNTRLRTAEAQRIKKEAELDADIDRIIKGLPPLTKGKASLAMDRLREALGIEGGSICTTVIAAANEIERLRTITRRLHDSLNPCGHCDYDEATGDLFCHCDECKHRIVSVAWELLVEGEVING